MRFTATACDALPPGQGDLGTIYGPVAFGTSAYSETLTDWQGGGVVGRP